MKRPSTSVVVRACTDRTSAKYALAPDAGCLPVWCWRIHRARDPALTTATSVGGATGGPAVADKLTSAVRSCGRMGGSRTRRRTVDSGSGRGRPSLQTVVVPELSFPRDSGRCHRHERDSLAWEFPVKGAHLDTSIPEGVPVTRTNAGHDETRLLKRGVGDGGNAGPGTEAGGCPSGPWASDHTQPTQVQ